MRPRHVVLAAAVAGLVAGPPGPVLAIAGAALLLAGGAITRHPGLGLCAACAILAGALDGARRRAERALEAGLPAPQAALARGMVLGQDEALDDRTRKDFRASGLSHLLAASGQNVALLALLATTGLALLGVGWRGR